MLIEANFLVKNDSKIIKNEDVDKSGIKIVVADRSAYDLWLKSNFKYSEIIRVKSINDSHEFYRSGNANVLAGLRPKLLDEIDFDNSNRIIDKPFTHIKQSVGFKKNLPHVERFLNKIILDAIKEGFIKNSLKNHNVDKKLSIPEIF